MWHSLPNNVGRGKKPYHGKKPKKGPHPSQNSRPKNGYAKKHKAKSTGAKNVARVKCYNYEKKGHLLGIVLSQPRYRFSLKLMNYISVPTHSLLTLFLNGL